MALTLESDTPATLGTPSLKAALNIKNFGPITKGKIELRPLTVFVGPNNTGKSYAARLVYSILRSLSSDTFFDRFENDIRKRLNIKLKNAGGRTDEYSIAISAVPSSKALEVEVGPRIAHDFLAGLETLVREGAKECRLQIAAGAVRTTLVFSKDDFHCSAPSAHKLTLRFRPVVGLDDPCSIVGAGDQLEVHVEKTLYDSPSSFIYYISKSLSEHQMPSIMDVFYLPAPRSGMLQLLKPFFASFIRSLSDLSDNKKVYMTGILTAFFSNIIECQPDRTCLYAGVAQDLEKDMLHGEVIIKHTLSVPEIKFKQNGREFSMEESSSTVSEMAPLILYLKHIVEDRSLLVIEEPEAHLHPVNQVIFARCVARLVNRGLNVLLTTHSPFLLEELSHLLEASRFTPRQREDRLQYRKDECLDPPRYCRVCV
jgi:predicted ATPase